MAERLSPVDTAKFVAASRAVEMVEDGMRLGLGTGSTASWMLRGLAGRIGRGLSIRAVPTSRATAEAAERLGIPLVPLDDLGRLDLTIDGADEVDPDLSLIKGAGGALLHEKIVAAASDRVVIIADAAKRVATLGAAPLPVEVVPFAFAATRDMIAELLAGQDVGGVRIEPRRAGGDLFVTDEGNHVLDLHLGRIGDPRVLALNLNQVPGVVETGLFLDLCDVLVTGDAAGRVEITDATAGTKEARLMLQDGANAFGDIAE